MTTTSLRDKLRAMQEGNAEQAPIVRTLGMTLLQFGDGKATFTMKMDSRFHNPMGTVHGGITTDLADASMGVALVGLLADDESFTTLELKCCDRTSRQLSLWRSLRLRQG